jgi:ABC-type bacteriocin/lantibiotic exporter with double-glycine peptidase domain
MAREREQLPVSPPSVVLGYFGAAVARHPWLVLLSVTGPIALQLATLATGWYMRDFFNLLVLPAGTVSEGVFLRVIVMVGIMLTVAWAARRMRGWSQIYLEVFVMEELMVDAFSGLMRHSYQFFSSQFSGTLTRRISKYRDAFETLYDVLTMSLIPLIVFIGGAAVVLSARNLVEV